MIDKEEFIKGILDIAKKNLVKDGHLLQVLFLDTDKGIIPVGLAGISNKDDMNELLGQTGKQFAKKGIKINTVFLLSDATSRTLPKEMTDTILEGNISKADIFKNTIETTDSIILLDWDLKNDKQKVTLQYYRKDKKDGKDIIFNGEPVKLENPLINMLDSFVYNYRSSQKKT